MCGSSRPATEIWKKPFTPQIVTIVVRSMPGVMLPESFDADRVRQRIHERYDLSLGTGLGKVKGRMFRIGHLGDSNDLTLLATLCGCEMGLKEAGVALAGSGVQAAMEHFASHPQQSALKTAA